MQNTYMNKMLQRIADAVERWTGGSITLDVTGAGDMQPATATAAGAHGLVPAPQAGDENKVLSGAGTWIDAGGGGGLDYSTAEQNTGVKWIDGKGIYQKSVEFTTGAAGEYHRLQTGILAEKILKVEFFGYNAAQRYNITMCGYRNPVPMDFAIACLPNLVGGNGIIVDYRTTVDSENIPNCVFTFWYTKTAE